MCMCLCVSVRVYTQVCCKHKCARHTGVQVLWWGRVVPPGAGVQRQWWTSRCGCWEKQGQRKLISIANLDRFQGNPWAVTPARQVLYYWATPPGLSGICLALWMGSRFTRMHSHPEVNGKGAGQGHNDRFVDLPPCLIASEGLPYELCGVFPAL